MIRVHTKRPGKALDESAAPFTLPLGCTVEDLAARIHKDLRAAMKFARLWGKGVFGGQTVHLTHVLSDGDIVEIHEQAATTSRRCSRGHRERVGNALKLIDLTVTET